jgi:hypothetical protein
MINGTHVMDGVCGTGRTNGTGRIGGKWVSQVDVMVPTGKTEGTARMPRKSW